MRKRRDYSLSKFKAVSLILGIASTVVLMFMGLWSVVAILIAINMINLGSVFRE